jgi:hypothetical protein
MSNSLAHRDPATLVVADVNDRRRLAVTEIVMHLEDGVPMHNVAIGQVILKHAEDGNDNDLLTLADKIGRRLR